METTTLNLSHSKLKQATVHTPRNNSTPIDQKLVITENLPRVYTFAPFLRQLFTAIGPFLGLITAGVFAGYSAVLLPQLIDPKSTIISSESDASWIASIGTIPMVITGIIGGLLMEAYGRRMTLMIVCIPLVFGWVIIAASKSLEWLVCGRFLTGFVSALASPCAVYVAEISEPKHRGLFLGSLSLSRAFGILIIHTIGTVLDWKLTAALSAIFPLLCYVMIFFVPESPTWLLNQNRIQQSENAFKWLRGTGIEAQEEFQKMIEKHKNNIDLHKYNNKVNKLQKLQELKRNKAFFKSLKIMIVFFTAFQFSGVNVFVFYCTSILEEVLNKEVDKYVAMIAFDILRVISSIFGIIFLAKYPRRPLALIGAGGTAVSLLCLSLLLVLVKQYKLLAVTVPLIPILPLITFIIFSTSGLIPLCSCMNGEIFPVAQRGLGSGITSAYYAITFFIFVKTSPTFLNAFGLSGAFFIFGFVTLICSIYLFFNLPETKNKTLQQIEEDINYK